MTLQQLFRILRARHRLILITTLVTVVAAVALNLTLPRKYSANTSLVINIKGVDPITGAVLPAEAMPSYMATQVDIIHSHAVALKVVKALKLADSATERQRFQQTGNPGLIEDWLAGRLLRKLDIKPSRESRIMEVVYTDVDPQLAARTVNAFARAYIQTNLEMKVEPARDSAVWFNEQVGQLRDQFEDAQSRLSRYQKEKGITSTDQRLDIEAAKLAELSTQLVQVEAQVYENVSRFRQLEEFTSRNRSVDSLPEVLASPVIQELKARLSAAEARLSQAPSTMGTNHPEFQRVQSEVNTLRKKLNDEVKTATSVINNNLRISQSRERELRDAVAAQKSRLIGLNRHRDELEVLMKEVDNAQRSYQSASQRRTETSLESRLDQSNVVILNPAIPPTSPASPPRLLFMLALSIAAGFVLGTAFALVREIADRRVRGADDLVEAIGIPVWGVLEDTRSLSKHVDRKNRKEVRRGRLLKSLQEPTLG
ncbi:MAG TPA: chain length determinant protein EpsF [Burkholderiales bacterium]|nr:chain length determinant protein EpsF [Burkholderiales bacterium]